MKDRGYTYQVLLNGETISDAFHVGGMPVVYVLGRDGRIAYAEVGSDDKAAASRRAVIASLVAQRES
jgi:hypothetical protein